MKRTLVVAIVLSAVASPARAQERRVTREWYGYYNLSADTAALGTLVFGATQGGGTLAWSSLFIYGVGGPIVHWAHGNVGTGFASLGMRVGAPLVLTFAGCALDDNRGHFGCLGGAVLGFVAGVLSASVIDAAVLAYKETEPPPRYGIRFTPTGSITRDGATLGVSALFWMLASAILATSVAATEPPITREWYGYYNLAIDSAAVGVLAISRTFRTTEGQTNLAIASVVLYTLGGPLVHVGHGKVGTAFGSLGLRVGVPAVGAGLGCVVTVAVSPGAPACAVGAGGGALVGMAAAIVLDSVALAYKERGTRLTPSGTISREGATFGLSGVF